MPTRRTTVRKRNGPGLVKAHVVQLTPAPSVLEGLLRSLESDETAADQGWLTPPYDPGKLIRAWEGSSFLRPNIDAYITNIDSFGHRFEPIIDLDAADAVARIREAILFERLAEAEHGLDGAGAQAGGGNGQVGGGGAGDADATGDADLETIIEKRGVSIALSAIV